jgi:uncharacterized protein
MTILQKEHNGQGAFYIEDERERIAEMTYYYAHDKMVINHTEVNERLRGQDIGVQLVDKGVAFAKEKQIKILPACPFVKALFQKSSKYDDVWK